MASLGRSWRTREIRTPFNKSAISVTESSDARFIYDGVVSSASPADIAYVSRKADHIYVHSKTSCIICFQNEQGHRPSGTRSLAHVLSVVAKTATCIALVPLSLRHLRLSHLLVISVGTRLV